MSFFAALALRAYEFDFNGTMRRLEAKFRDRPRFGAAMRPADEPIRLGQEPSVAFAPAPMVGFVPPAEGQPGRLSVAFLGLFGPNGPLPLHLTEYARERMRHAGDRTFSAFADVFNHRMLLLFYRAWAQVEPTVWQDRPEESRFDDYVGSLMGLGLPALREREGIPDRAKLQYVGLLSNPVRSAEGLRAIIEDYFEVPAEIAEFQGEWLEVPVESRLELGGASEVSSLGRTTLLGRRAFAVQHKFRVCLGPLTRQQLTRFLPGGASLPQLTTLVRGYAGDALAWDLQLRLRPDASCQVRLGGSERLAYNARLGRGAPTADVIIDPLTKGAPADRASH